MTKSSLKLNKGDTIGVISPAGGLRGDYKDKFARAIELFEQRGYNIKIAPHACEKNNYLASTDENRLNDLITFFKDKEIKAILCSRGGYGTTRLLDKIDYSIIKKNPKIFVGYSDITALLNVFHDKTGLVTFHGPLFVSDFGEEEIDEYTVNNFFEILENRKKGYNYQNSEDYTCIHGGTTRGKLVGGNLTVLNSLLGTKFFPAMDDKILLLEDIGESLYKIDRMINQLRLAGVFNQVRAVLFANFTDIDNEYNITTIDVIKNLLQNYNLPIGYGFSASHKTAKSTLLIGGEYEFNATDFNLKLIK